MAKAFADYYLLGIQNGFNTLPQVSKREREDESQAKSLPLSDRSKSNQEELIQRLARHLIAGHQRMWQVKPFILLLVQPSLILESSQPLLLLLLMPKIRSNLSDSLVFLLAFLSFLMSWLSGLIFQFWQSWEAPTRRDRWCLSLRSWPRVQLIVEFPQSPSLLSQIHQHGKSLLTCKLPLFSSLLFSNFVLRFVSFLLFWFEMQEESNMTTIRYSVRELEIGTLHTHGVHSSWDGTPGQPQTISFPMVALCSEFAKGHSIGLAFSMFSLVYAPASTNATVELTFTKPPQLGLPLLSSSDSKPQPLVLN